MYPPTQVPTFGGKSSPFIDYDQSVRLWNQSADVSPSKRASMLIPQMNPGGGACVKGEGAETILNTLRNYFQPDALGHVYQHVAKFRQ